MLVIWTPMGSVELKSTHVFIWYRLGLCIQFYCEV